MIAAVVRIVLIALVVGCGASFPTLPSKGGPAWVEFSSPNFTVWTDAGIERGAQLIRQLERMRQIVLGVAFPGARESRSILVIALRDDDELQAVSPFGSHDSFVVMGGAPPLHRPTLVLSAYTNRDTADRRVASALTQLIGLSVAPRLPRWLSEALSMYFGAVDLDPDRTTADLGEAPMVRGERLQLARLMSVRNLLAWRWGPDGDTHHYSTAWALYTYLINQHRPALTRYVASLLSDAGAAPEPESAADAWAAAMPGLSPDEVDAALRQWLTSGSHTVVHIKIAVKPFETASRTMQDADVQAVVDMLAGWRGARAASPE